MNPGIEKMDQDAFKKSFPSCENVLAAESILQIRLILLSNSVVVFRLGIYLR